MGSEEILSNISGLFHAHTAIAITIIAVMGMLFYFKPKPMLKLVATLLVFISVFYIFSLFGEMTSTGYSQKVKMVDGTP